MSMDKMKTENGMNGKGEEKNKNGRALWNTRTHTYVTTTNRVQKKRWMMQRRKNRVETKCLLNLANVKIFLYNVQCHCRIEYAIKIRTVVQRSLAEKVVTVTATATAHHEYKYNWCVIYSSEAVCLHIYCAILNSGRLDLERGKIFCWK